VNADMIAKWERGEKSPSPRYRELLCLLYGATPEYLGIAHITKGKTSPSPKTTSPVVIDQDMVDALGGATAILDQLGPAGGILQPRMFDAWKNDLIHRRVVLKLMGIMPAVTALPAVAESARRSRSGKPTPDNVHDLEQLANRYQALYHSTAPAALMTPVVAHLSTLNDLLRQRPSLAGCRFSTCRTRWPPGRTTASHWKPPARRATTGRPSPRSDTSPSFPPRWTTCTAPARTSDPSRMARSRPG
jgi:hypothetical protein